MTKKIKISESRKKAIKLNFDFNKPPKRKNELSYWNKVKAGKIRFDSAIKENGKIVLFPKRYIDDFLKPHATSLGMNVKEYLQDKNYRFDALQEFKKESLDWSYNYNSINTFFKNKPNNQKIYIFYKGKKKEVNELELRAELVNLKQLLADNGIEFFAFNVEVKKSLTEAVFILPELKKLKKDFETKDIEEIKEIYEEEEFYIYDSVAKKDETKSKT